MALYQVIIFAGLATLKLLVEVHAGRHVNRGGVETSRSKSIIFIITGSLAPVLILAEILLWRHSLPLPACLVFAMVQLAMLGLRVASVNALGKFYSVHVRICADHQLVQKGPYRYVRHPLYLVGIIESFAYPLACGAPVTALVLSVIGIPAILLRRAEEEGALLQKFGAEYEAYRRRTLF